MRKIILTKLLDITPISYIIRELLENLPKLNTYCRITSVKRNCSQHPLYNDPFDDLRYFTIFFIILQIYMLHDPAKLYE